MTNNQLAENSVNQLLNSVRLARDNAERDDNRVDHSFYYALTIALEELQEHRKAEMGSKPVAWLAIYHGEVYDEAIGITRSVVEAQADRFGWESALTEIIPLYRHAQPAPVVQCPYPCGWDNLNKLAIQDAALVARGLVEGEPTTEAQRQAAISNNDRLLKVISACRAAMLQAGNSPVIPDTWIPVSERMPDDSSDVLCTAEFDGPGDWRKKVGYWHEGKWVVYGASWTPTHWMPLPAAPQEVQGE